MVELHAYAVPEDIDEARIREVLVDRLYDVYPELRGVSIIEDRFLLRQDCPAFLPGSYATRPTVETPFKGVALAGDFIRTPFPSALMERATATGFMAANHLLEEWNARPEPIFSVPPKGFLAAVNRFSGDGFL